jgi:probable F420-dependent oxidoreductase
MSQHRIQFALKWNMYGNRPETPFSDYLKIARAAEDLGFDAVYTIDHIGLPATQVRGFSSIADEARPSFPEAWTALAAAAAVTKRVKLGPQVTPISLRHPVFIAKMATNVDLISNGRLVLQVGTGWHQPEFDAFGFPYDQKYGERYGKMIEGVEIIKKLWTEDAPVTYHGQYYHLQDAPFWPKPFQKPHPPIWFGGSSKKTQTAVAKYGDAWSPAAPHYTGLDTEEYRAGFENIRRMAAEHGRDPDAIKPAALFYSVIHRERSRAYELAENLRKREEWSTLSVPEMARNGVAIIGDPDDCVNTIERYVRAGIRYFTIGIVPIREADAIIEGMQLYSERIFPHFKDRCS